jgi:hypothetical protein
MTASSPHGRSSLLCTQQYALYRVHILGGIAAAAGSPYAELLVRARRPWETTTIAGRSIDIVCAHVANMQHCFAKRPASIAV